MGLCFLFGILIFNNLILFPYRTPAVLWIWDSEKSVGFNWWFVNLNGLVRFELLSDRKMKIFRYSTCISSGGSVEFTCVDCKYLLEIPWSRPCHSSGGKSPASRSGCPGSSPGLWWTEWHCGRFSLTTSIYLVNPHSTDCSTLIIINRGWYSRPVSGRRTKWTQSHPTPRNL
jgi:hypothetical protein